MATRIALVVGINYYEHVSQLHGCVNDAYSIENILKRDDGGLVNFDTRLLTASSPAEAITRGKLKDSLSQLFSVEAEIALFYFAGHGYMESTGGYLIASDAKRGDEGLSLHEVMSIANKSPATNKVIILDSCHSGIAAESLDNDKISSLSDGMTILTASTKDQYASEEDGSGVFTSLMVDALSGSGANLVGQITPGSVYAHIDQSLGLWEQRPIFKTNVKKFVSLRQVSPPISIEDLRLIVKYFPTRGFEFKLDPTYEPELKGRDSGIPDPVEEHTQIFSVLQKYNRLNLLIPVDAPHMWHAAMESKGCRLTALGEHYRRLVAKERI